MRDVKKFSVEDNTTKLFTGEDIKIVFPINDRSSRIWVLSFEQLVDLQTAIATYIAGDRLA